MQLIWNPEKRERNLAKHGLDFADAHAVFRGAVFTFEDKRRGYGEQRFFALGMLEDLAVALAFTEAEEDLIRPISRSRARSLHLSSNRSLDKVANLPSLWRNISMARVSRFGWGTYVDWCRRRVEGTVDKVW